MSVFLSRLLSGLPHVEHAFGSRDWSPPAGVRTLHQIHSTLVRDTAEIAAATEGDALTTREAGKWIAVKTADCVPILIADRAGRAVAAVHAGWRGAAAGVLHETVHRLGKDYQIFPTELLAAIGPSIGPCCYEVGPEVAAQFRADEMTGKHLDLWLACSHQLIRAGVPALQIERLGLCTRCRPLDFHSWRRDGSGAGRMFSCVRVVPK